MGFIKKDYIRGIVQKEGLGQFADLRRCGSKRKREGGGFDKGLIPNVHHNIYIYICIYIYGGYYVNHHVTMLPPSEDFFFQCFLVLSLVCLFCCFCLFLVITQGIATFNLRIVIQETEILEKAFCFLDSFYYNFAALF